jgi:hypothetical protein
MSTTIITNQLKEVLDAANIRVSKTELENIEALIDRCKENSLQSSAAADLICRDLDIDDVGIFSSIKNGLITKGIFKN